MILKNSYNGKRVKENGENERSHGYLRVQIGFFFAVLFLLAVISWIIPLRPTTSEAEKRDLAEFPSFSWEMLASGDYFDGINTWFADTFPFRDLYVTMNGKFQSLLSPGGMTIHGDVEEGDDIPDNPVVPDGSSEEQGSGDEPVVEDPVVEDPVIDVPQKDEEDPDIEDPDMTGVPTESLGAILIVGNAAYEYYGFSQKAADTYVQAVNKAADQLEGVATVYSLVVPTSIDIMLPADVRKNVNSADQRKAIDYIFGAMDDNVVTVDIFNTMRNHREEYIYYRTDHHWTQLGAYYAYREFCEARGVAPAELNEAFTEANYGNFLGSFYSDSGKKAALSQPDTLMAYVPKDTNTATITRKDGSLLAWSAVTDVSNWKTGAKYSSFIGGDNPWTVIENPNVTDGSACILIKESFGNAFAPCLVPSYQTVYVVDYRYIGEIKSDKLAAIVESTGAQDVLFVNNISATRSNALMNAVSRLVG